MNGDGWDLQQTVPLEMTGCKSGPGGQSTHHRRSREGLVQKLDLGSWEISPSVSVQCSLT